MDMDSFRPAADSMAKSAPLDYEMKVPFMGLPTRVRSNSSAVLRTMESLLGGWRYLDESERENGAQLEIDLIVHPHNLGEFGGLPLMYRVHERGVLAARSADMLAIDADRGLAVAFLAPETAGGEREALWQVARSIALNVALGRDRHPVHAAAVVGGRHPVLLVGASGIGKSTLCYACVREGFRFMSEDATFVSLERGLTAWQCLPDIHIPVSVRERFPELAAAPVVCRGADEPEVRIETSGWGPDRSCLHAADPVVCILARRESTSSALQPADADTVMELIGRQLEPGFDLGRRPLEVARGLARGRTYRLCVGTEPEEAVMLLREVAD